jgi:DNA-binding XRE family transcriptional regulator
MLMTALHDTTTATRLEKLLHSVREDSAAQLVEALEIGNQLLRPSDLSAILVQLSDHAWDELALLHQQASAFQRTHSARTAIGHLLSVDPQTFLAIAHFRQVCIDARHESDRERMKIALDAIRIAITPPDQVQVTSSDLAEEPGDPALADAEATIARDRAGRFLRNYRRARAEVAARNPRLKTQRQLAKAAGLSIATISAIENGHVRPQLATIVKLAAALDVPVQRLAG